MTETGDRVGLACPSCSPGEETVHEVLRPGGQATVRCTECDHTHKAEIPEEETVRLTVVVSQDGESFSTEMDVPADTYVATGEEFVVDSPDALMQVRVTGIEVGPEQRVEEADIETVETLWTRAVDNVTVPVTLHPKDGDADQTRSLRVNVPGDHEFTVGETATFGEEEFTIEGVQIREDAPEYRHEKLDHEGDFAYAKDCKRVYARDESLTAWSAW
ncbi:zinc finger protein [Halorubrum saccharovorum]|uniref:Zinc finger protein n=1 Tax=Halorubrum saccharovorum TaxID=2248 RepID=A0A081EUJ2_9EURY|nr:MULTISPECIES: HVO_0476 family zinc finger protein [Halorubrum]KDS91080.1 zinc finger protein [Halorubrum saccharovorum]